MGGLAMLKRAFWYRGNITCVPPSLSITQAIIFAANLHTYLIYISVKPFRASLDRGDVTPTCIVANGNDNVMINLK